MIGSFYDFLMGVIFVGFIFLMIYSLNSNNRIAKKLSGLSILVFIFLITGVFIENTALSFLSIGIGATLAVLDIVKHLKDNRRKMY